MPLNQRTISFPVIDHQKEMVLDESLAKYLESLGKSEYFTHLSYILKELANNANKANLKRIYFLQRGIDINSQVDYEDGMKEFKEYINTNMEKYIEELKKNKYFVRIDFYLSNNYFVMSVINNAKLLPIEKKRISEKMKNAVKFKTMEEVFSQGLDQIEGGGFGTILTILMLRKMGLDAKMLRYLPKDKYTQVQILVPMTLVTPEESDVIAQSVIEEINDIPQFPQHLLKLLEILNNPNAVFEDISDIVMNDPSLIADVLKTANSGLYSLAKRVESVQEAVRLLGFKIIKNIVLTHSTKQTLMNKYNLETINKIMEHSFEVSFYAQSLVKKYNLRKITDNTFVCAMLHDFGKIIIKSIKPNLMENIQKICFDKGVNNFIVENLTDGYNHSIIGARLAEKWNFPEFLIETIKYHHIPLQASEENQDLVFVTHLGDVIYYYLINEIEFDDINYKVLQRFNLTNKEDFTKMVDIFFNEFCAIKEKENGMEKK